MQSSELEEEICRYSAEDLLRGIGEFVQFRARDGFNVLGLYLCQPVLDILGIGRTGFPLKLVLPSGETIRLKGWLSRSSKKSDVDYHVWDFVSIIETTPPKFKEVQGEWWFHPGLTSEQLAVYQTVRGQRTAGPYDCAGAARAVTA
jgi:hypothetical protein